MFSKLYYEVARFTSPIFPNPTFQDIIKTDDELADVIVLRRAITVQTLLKKIKTPGGFLQVLKIIYLTRQPVGRRHTPDPSLAERGNAYVFL